MESSHVSLKVSFIQMCIQYCLEDTDCCAGSDVIWKCIPGLCCGVTYQTIQHTHIHTLKATAHILNKFDDSHLRSSHWFQEKVAKLQTGTSGSTWWTTRVGWLARGAPGVMWKRSSQSWRRQWMKQWERLPPQLHLPHPHLLSGTSKFSQMWRLKALLFTRISN